MIARVRKHNFYEVWNEHTAESVFVHGKRPTMDDLVEICVNEEWGFKEINALKRYIKSHIHVDKFDKIYSHETSV